MTEWTNERLMRDLNYKDELIIKSNDPSTVKEYYDLLMNGIEFQIDAAVEWLQTSEAQEAFREQAQIQQILQEKWDESLTTKQNQVQDVLNKAYSIGKLQGSQDIGRKIRYTPTDYAAIEIARNYNYGLIGRLDSDLQEHMQQTMTRAMITGQHPTQVAQDVLRAGVTPLEGSTLSAQQRAVMIARTENSRIKNTAILQTYENEGFQKVRILTAEDSNVCALCLNYAYEYNTRELTLENRGSSRIHDISSASGSLSLPMHPNCRCTYIADWESYTGPPEHPMTIDLTQN